jgi:hypothetical protein
MCHKKDRSVVIHKLLLSQNNVAFLISNNDTLRQFYYLHIL